MPHPTGPGPEPVVEVRRSRRRRRTVSAYRDGDRVIVLMPAGFTPAQEARWVQDMVRRMDRAERRRAAPTGDADLMARALSLSRRHVAGAPQPTSVRWVANQQQRWGSCTPAAGTIRLSTRLRDLPTYVGDYVLVHELAHLRVAGHGPGFWALVAGYPLAERARGYLEGVTAAAGLVGSWGEPGGSGTHEPSESAACTDPPPAGSDGPGG